MSRTLFTLVLLLVLGPAYAHAQEKPQTKDKWERVYTGEESVIEVNASSLRFEPDSIVRVQFRTILSHPETLPGTSGAKYKIRLETIDFKANEKRYRFFEITLLDANGKQLQTYSTDKLQEWRVPKPGSITERLLNAARVLPPFGTWKVVAYRSEDESRPEELEKLIGTRVNLQFDRAEVGAKVCTFPAFEDRRSSRNDEVFQELGKSIGIQVESAEMITIRCKSSGWQPPQSVLIKVAEGEMLMLWEGVFLVLKR